MRALASLNPEYFRGHLAKLPLRRLAQTTRWSARMFQPIVKLQDFRQKWSVNAMRNILVRWKCVAFGGEPATAIFQVMDNGPGPYDTPEIITIIERERGKKRRWQGLERVLRPPRLEF